jgi:hypothetical protein
MKRATQIEHVCRFLNEADRGRRDYHDHHSTHSLFLKIKKAVQVSELYLYYYLLR